MSTPYLHLINDEELPRLNHFLKRHRQTKTGRGDLNFVLYDNQTILGHARLISLETEHAYWLRGVFITPEHRRKGFGSDLLQQLQRIMHNRFSSGKIFAFPLAHLDEFYAQLGYQDWPPEALPNDLRLRYQKAQQQHKGWLCKAIDLDMPELKV